MSSTNDDAQTRVEPRLLRGFRDYLPGDLIARERMIAAIRKVFESHGFAPLATPALEPLDVLGRSDLEDESGTGGGSIFHVVDPDSPGGLLGMRFDLTVPLARVVSQYPELPRPFRRYQLGSVWRVDKPAPGRFREFTQFDLDIVGTAQMDADAEIVACMVETLRALEVPRFRVRINNRKILNGVLDFAGVVEEERQVEVEGRQITYEARLETLRALDKMDRLGLEGVAELLGAGRKDETGDFKFGVGLAPDAIAKLGSYLQIPAEDRGETLARLRELLAGQPVAEEGIEELAEIHAVLDALKIDSSAACIDPTIVRGLAYYTGPVFEAVLLDALQFGSIFSGGRYDGLVERFQDEVLPSTGASVGVDRLLAALGHLDLLERRSSTADILVTVMDATRRPDYLAMAAELRAQGFSVEVFLGTGGFRKQLKYADKQGIPIALIAGGDEFARGEVSLKDLWAGAEISKRIQEYAEWKENPTQISVSRSGLVAAVREMRERQRAQARRLREEQRG